MADSDNDEIVSIQLDRSRTRQEPLYAQLYSRIIELIRAGQLAPGYALPPVRRLAGSLAINPGTVVKAYKELENNGYALARPGSGFYITEPPAAAAAMPAGEGAVTGTPAEELPRLTDTAPLRVEMAADTEILPEHSDCINMRSISLNPDIVSVQQFKEFVCEVLDRDGARVFAYQDSQGYTPLRESLARYLAHNGIMATAEQIQIISGAQQGIDLTARALLSHGDYVFTESPTYPGAVVAFKAYGARVVDIPMTGQGIDVRRLEQLMSRLHPKLIYVMPNIQNPTGISYDRDTRARVMGLARYYGAYVLEDDYISELCYGEPLAPLKALDRDDRVIYLKSFSKMFLPGLRLAFLYMPQQLRERLLTMKQITDRATSGLTQRVFNLYLRRGVWQHHVASLREVYQTQFCFTDRVLRARLQPGWTFTAPLGGLSFWLSVPDGLSSTELEQQAARHHLLIADGAQFYPHHADHRHIRLSIATVSLPEIETGVDILRRLGDAGGSR